MSNYYFGSCFGPDRVCSGSRTEFPDKERTEGVHDFSRFVRKYQMEVHSSCLILVAFSGSAERGCVNVLIWVVTFSHSGESLQIQHECSDLNQIEVVATDPAGQNHL